MELERYAEFLTMRGYTVLQINGIHWLKLAPFFYSGILPFYEINPQESDVRQLRRTRALLGAWYACPAGVCGKVEDLNVEDATYSFENLEPKARNQTRRGVERCKVARVEFSDLEQCGLQINISALERQHRASVNRDLISRNRWTKRMRVCAATPDFSAWGAFVDNMIVAYAICLKVEGHGIIQSTMSLSEYLKFNPNNALIFTVTRELFAAGAKSVHYGFASDDPKLVRFKENMGYKRRPVSYKLDMSSIAYRLARLTPRFRHYFGAST